jgi:hypothetical protein
MAQGANYNLISPFNVGGVISGVLQGVNGSAVAPAYSFSADPTSGSYLASVGVPAIAAAGLSVVQVKKDPTVPTFGDVGINMAPVTGVALAIRIDQNVSAQDAIQVLSNNGTTTLFRVGYNGIVVAYNQVQLNNNGTVFSPSINIGSSGGQGIYSTGANNISFSTSSANAGSISSTQQWSGIKWQTASKAASYPVVAADSGTVFDNTGSAGPITFTLPGAVLGLTFTFGTRLANAITVAPQATDYIGAKAVNTPYASGLVAGQCFTVTCTAPNYWLITSNVGFT